MKTYILNYRINCHLNELDLILQSTGILLDSMFCLVTGFEVKLNVINKIDS